MDGLLCSNGFRRGDWVFPVGDRHWDMRTSRLAIRGEEAFCPTPPLDDAMLSTVMLGSHRQGHRWAGHGDRDRRFLDLSAYRLGKLAGSAVCFRAD